MNALLQLNTVVEYVIFVVRVYLFICMKNVYT